MSDLQTFIISTTDTGLNVPNWGIRVASRRRLWAKKGEEMYSHIRVGFGHGQPEHFFESIVAEHTMILDNGGRVTKNGVRGPISMEEHWQWVASDPKHHQHRIQPVLCMDDAASNRSREMLMEARKYVRYDKRQIVQNARYMLTGNMGRRKSIDPLEWTCSETGFHVFDPGLQLALGLGNFVFDWISPSGLYGLTEMTEQANEKFPTSEHLARYKRENGIYCPKCN